MTDAQTMTAEVRQTFGATKVYGPYPFTPEADFETCGATVDQLESIMLKARRDGAVSGYCEIVYRGKGGFVVDEEIAII